jgi:jumonji domain-containing protein 7
MAASHATTGTQSALRELIATFNDLNIPAVEDFDEEPSPLEFMRFVARNTPFVVRGGASSWPSAHKWSPEYLKSVLHGQTVNVAVTPHGYVQQDCPPSTYLELAIPHW